VGQVAAAPRRIGVWCLGLIDKIVEIGDRHSAVPYSVATLRCRSWWRGRRS
jgi:hypothetical protein